MRAAIAVLTLWSGWMATVSSHELGTTQALAAFRSDRTYQIDISFDPDALLTRIELASGAEISSDLMDVEERNRRIVQLADVFLDGVDVRFDGKRSRPRFEYRSAPEGVNGAIPGVVRLIGQTPSGARAWSFSYRFAMGWYALEVRAGDRPARTVWLEGGKPGASIALYEEPATSPAWLSRLTPLFVLGLVLMSVRRRRSQ